MPPTTTHVRTARRSTVPSRSGAERVLDVLVVDDEESARGALRAAVEALGHSCRVASDGWEALRMHEADPADVLICDWWMAGMDGMELCRRVRALHGARYTYLLFVSADASKHDFVEAARAGADDCLPKSFELDDLELRLIAAARLVKEYGTLSDRNVQLRRDSQARFREARIDPLTGVLNRLRLEEDLDSVQTQVSRYGRRVSVAMCDLDGFKRYNDRYGHLAGDHALRRIAGAIRSSVRRADHVYRYGGEEFLVVLPEQRPAQAAAAMDRVRAAVEQLAIAHAPGGTRALLTISVGLATVALEGDRSVRAAVARADRALYRAKAAGGNVLVLEAGATE